MLSPDTGDHLGIAEEIHDGPLQLFSAAAMRIDLLISTLNDHDREALDQSWGVLSEGIDGLRAILERHYVDQGADEGLKACLERAVLPYHSGTELVVRNDALTVEPTGDLSRLIRRVAREAILNAFKHAHAAQILVDLATERGGVLVIVEDDGVGFDTDQAHHSGHLGLRSSADEAQMAGGWWSINSRPGDGTTVEFWIPLRTQAPGEPP